MPVLALVRHGQSLWNQENRFSGWADVDLSDEGVRQARQAGAQLADMDLLFSHAYTSDLRRAIRTLWSILEVMDLCWVPQTVSWRLNERHYGALQGMNKDAARAEFGKDQVHQWRRSFDQGPPPLNKDDPRHPRFDRKYKGLPAASLPSGESLKDTLERVLPIWESAMAARIRRGENLIVTAHGNSIRALLKHLLDLNADTVMKLEVPTGNPLALHFVEGDLKIAAARYLDDERAQALPRLPAL
jgi:2,3-bisphosphoglycerate-dependent phosphoglycerate mutase